MQSGYTGHIVAAEWRWVIVVATVLVLIAFAPFIWITVNGAASTTWQFMGVLHNYPEGAAYLAKMEQAQGGQWLTYLQHTPEAHNPIFFHPIYLLLGQLARLISVSPIIMFHIARVVASIMMYMALYQLAASIWMRVRTRRLFFLLASIGAGFGWLFGVTSGNVTYPDLTLSEAFPIQSTLVNVHFPLGLACLALLASVIISAFRLDSNGAPDVNNGGLAAALLSLALALLYPEVLVVFAVSVLAYVHIICYRLRRIAMWAVRWWLIIVLPAFPVFIIYTTFFTYNSAMAEWNSQKVTPAPNPLILALALGIPLILGLPGIWRAIRRFEPDGDQYMLIWLVTMVVLVYLPTNFQRRFAGGMMLSVAYFTARSLEDFWFQYVSRRWRLRLLALFVPLISLSHLVVIFGPIFPLLSNNFNNTDGLFLERDYTAAFQWIDDHTRSTDVVLASPNVSLWLPAWANVRVVYGHPYETLDAKNKKDSVVTWYRLDDSSGCGDLLRTYSVRYAIYGPEEQNLGTGICTAGLTFIANFGRVNLYLVTR